METALSKDELSRDAPEVLRLVRAYRSIKDRAIRLQLLDVIEAMTADRAAPDDKTKTK